MTNAIKFTPSGGKIIVSTQLAQRNGIIGLQISIADTGIGIAAKEQEKIFRRFYRGREAGTEGERGSGLGLAICNKIMQLHGGSLEISSEKNKGTVATAWFPLAPDRVNQSADKAAKCDNEGETEQEFPRLDPGLIPMSTESCAGGLLDV
jgi:signal transduction histidine kinase